MKRFKGIASIFILLSLIFLVGCQKQYIIIPKEIDNFNEIKEVKNDKYIKKIEKELKDQTSFLFESEIPSYANYYLINIITDKTDDNYDKYLLLKLNYADGKEYSFKTIVNNELTLKDIKYREIIIATNHSVDDIYVLDRFGQKIPLEKHNLKYFEKFLQEMDNLEE